MTQSGQAGLEFPTLRADRSRAPFRGMCNPLRLLLLLAAEIASVLAFSAIRNNDKVGLILFSDEVEKFIPPRKGRRHVLRVIREVLFFEAKRLPAPAKAQE